VSSVGSFFSYGCVVFDFSCLHSRFLYCGSFLSIDAVSSHVFVADKHELHQRCAMNGNNNCEAPTMAPGTNKVTNVVSPISHIPLPQWKVAVDSRYQNSEMKWKARFEESEKRRKSLLTQTQKSNYD